MPSISEAVEKSSHFKNRAWMLELRNLEDPLYEELKSAHVQIAMQAVLNKQDYVVGMSVGEIALRKLYEKLAEDGKMDIKNIDEAINNDQKALDGLARNITPSRLGKRP